MDEEIVADITGRFILNHGGDSASSPIEGRIITTEKRIVLVTNDGKETIPLSTVVDVNVGKVPPNVKGFFQETITVGYEPDDALRTVVIESSDEITDTLVSVLFRSLLNGAPAAVKHPARVGGRVKDSPVLKGKLRIRKRRVDVQTKRGGFSIDVATVMNLDRTNKLATNDGRVTLVVKHADPGSRLTKTTQIAPKRSQVVNLLARYLRLEYDEIREEAGKIELTDPEKRVLVSVHATGGDIDFANMLDGDSTYVTNILNSVQRKNLIEDGGDQLSLTPQGRIVVNQRIEDVNV